MLLDAAGHGPEFGVTCLYQIFGRQLVQFGKVAGNGRFHIPGGLRVIPVAGRDSMLLNLSGAHAPFFTRNLVVLTDNAGHTGVGEATVGAVIPVPEIGTVFTPLVWSALTVTLPP